LLRRPLFALFPNPGRQTMMMIVIIIIMTMSVEQLLE
jgi:hypothetical protein